MENPTKEDVSLELGVATQRDSVASSRRGSSDASLELAVATKRDSVASSRRGSSGVSVADRRAQWVSTSGNSTGNKSYVSRRLSLFSNSMMGSGDMEAKLARAQLLAQMHDSHVQHVQRRGTGFSSRRLSLVSFAPSTEGEEEEDEPVKGISAVLATFLTANFISVGYLFVPYGKKLVSAL